MRYLTALAALGLAIGGYVQPAAAITMNGSCTAVALSPTELSNATMTCGNFDSSLGTLTSITLNITGHIEGTISLQNNGATAATGSGTTSSAFTANPLAGFTLSNPLLTLSYTSGAQTIASGASYASGPLSNSASTGPLINTSNLSLYEDNGGTGTFNVVLNTLSGLTILGGGGNFVGGQTTSASANMTVVYEYNVPTPPTVPEPASMALLGSGLLGLGLMIRRRRRS